MPESANSEPQTENRPLVRIRTTRIRTNFLLGLVIGGIIIVAGYKAGVPQEVLSGIDTLLGMILMKIVESDNQLSPTTEPKK